MPMPSDYIPIGEGLFPDGTPGALFDVSAKYLEQLDQVGDTDALDDARFVDEAVTRPDAIFEGLAEDAEAFGYSVRVQRDPEEPDSTTLPRYGAVLVASVRARMGYVVYRWVWENEDPDQPGHPAGWEKLYGRRTWSRS